MKFVPVSVSGAFLIVPGVHEDQRGGFMRTFCRREFAQQGLVTEMDQCSLSSNRRRGTLRGIHYQVAPAEEVKLVRCVRGAIFDVVLDLRPGSPTYLRHFGTTLDVDNGRALYIPAGCGHGFQTLRDDTDVHYQISGFYSPKHARGVRWDDPAFGIDWPVDGPIMNERDATVPDHPARQPA